MLNKNGEKTITLLVAAFLLGGILHVVMARIDFTDCFTQLYYSILVLWWGQIVNSRVNDHYSRRIIQGIVFFQMLFFILQICKYRLFMSVERYFWYAYYIPMMWIPLLLLYLALYMNRQEDDVPRQWAFAAFPAIILPVFVLTNDLHQLFAQNDRLTTDISLQNAGVVYYFVWIYVSLLLLMSLVIMIRKCKIAISNKRKGYLLGTIAICVVLMMTNAVGLRPGLMGRNLWNIGELFAFSTIIILEVCIQIGLIQANTGYIRIFENLDIPVVINDCEGKQVYATAAKEDFEQTLRDAYIRTAPVTGGTVSWIVDLSTVNTLNQKLEDVTEQIKVRNSYLKTQIAIREENAAVNVRNAVYDRIAGIVENQLVKINELLTGGTQEDFPERLKIITVLNAYIKRRGNLELLRENGIALPASEIVTAIAESADYMKLSGLDVIFNSFAEGTVSADAAILTYELFELVAEYVLDHGKKLSIVLNCRESLSLRMVINSIGFSCDPEWKQEELTACNGEFFVIRNDEDTIISLRFERGGEVS